MMDKNKIIILVLVVVIIALLAAMAVTMPNMNKKDTKLTLQKNATINEGGSFKVKLTDLNGTPLSNQTINISIIDEDGSINHKSVVTNEKGKATLKLDKNPGNYSINCTFDGNDNYTNCSAFKKVKIKEKVEEIVSSQYDSYSSESHSSQSGDDYRPEVDSSGITREQADKYGWRYTTEHGGHYRGVGDHWDENAGIYHD